MVEIVARAIAHASVYEGYDAETREREWVRHRNIYRAQARAALAAITREHVLLPREPSDVMWLGFFSRNAKRGTDGMEEFHYWEGDWGNFVASYYAMRDAYTGEGKG